MTVDEKAWIRRLRLLISASRELDVIERAVKDMCDTGAWTSKEGTVLRRRIEDHEKLSDVAAMFGVTPERIRQIESAALLKVRNYGKR